MGGDVHVCCSGWVPRPVGNILGDDILEIWRGEKVKQVRDSVAGNSFTYCLECPYLPGPHGTVQPVDQSLPEKPTSARIAVLTLAYEHTCNLACPSCRSAFFKSDQAHELQARAISARIIESGMLGHVERMIVTGSGDPFASPVYASLLRDVPWREYRRLRVGLYTNALLADKPNWARFGEAVDRIDQVTVSVDAASPETYALNRRGNWDHLLENLKYALQDEDCGAPQLAEAGLHSASQQLPRGARLRRPGGVLRRRLRPLRETAELGSLQSRRLRQESRPPPLPPRAPRPAPSPERREAPRQAAGSRQPGTRRGTMTGDLWGLVAYWNPRGYRSRRRNFEVFRRRVGVPLVVVEMRTATPDLSARDAEVYLGVPPGAELWQKERLYNLALELVPDEAEYVATLDADVIFSSPDWAAKAVRTLGDHPVVQLWNRVRFLGPGSLEVPDADEGMTEARSSASELACGREADVVCETGRAWAMHKDLVKKHGFYDRSVVGSATCCSPPLPTARRTP